MATFNFGKAYKELEGIVSDFESREIDLEKDLPKFEKGLKLAQQLQKKLQEAENRIKKIEKEFTD